MNTITLITGGVKSGKSSYALSMANTYLKKAFIATAEAFDNEMKHRIARHKSERDQSFFLIEEPCNLGVALHRIPVGTDVAVIDCLTVWIGNVMHKNSGHADLFSEIDSFFNVIKNPPCSLIVITNEVGMGIVPENELSRAYRDRIGMVNQKIASIAHNVIFMVCGIPLMIKNTQPLSKIGNA